MRLIVLCLLLLSIVGCAVNPVTGENQLSMYGTDWDLQTGEQYYGPLRQQQGGDFVLDTELVDYVREVGQRVAAVSDVDLPYEFNVLNSSIPNAWALPGGKISINRGLLVEMNSEAELAAVLGHEVVHAAARHGASNASRGALIQGAVILGGVAVGVATESQEYASVAMMGGMLGAQALISSYSRDAERESDYYGTKYMHEAGYNPMGAVRLQQSFVRLSEGRSASSFDMLFSSHPPSQERVENNQRRAEELGRTGEIGEQRYQRMTARLRELQPAYEAHDKGRKAMGEGNHQAALAKAEDALAMEDDEALFHALKGDALASAERYREAERAYNRAVSLDDSWFYHQLRRGMVRTELNNSNGARQDLEASLTLLPTAQGHYFLGLVERQSGNRQRAIEQFRIAAQSEGEIGERARAALNDMGIAP